MTKTNVMRLLDAAGIVYQAGSYEVDEDDLSGSHAADLMGVDRSTPSTTRPSERARACRTTICWSW